MQPYVRFFTQSDKDAMTKDFSDGEDFISPDVVQKVVDSICEDGGANTPVKQVILSGLGEPLLNKYLEDIIRIIKKSKVADNLAVITNGTLLNEHVGQRLVEAGLDEVRISVNGLTSEDYKNNTNRNVDFEKLVQGIKRFRRETQGTIRMYIKIIDYMVRDDTEKTRFRSIFTPLADEVKIEHLVKVSPYIDFDGISQNSSYSVMQKADSHIVNAKICPRSFYEAVVRTSGDVTTCCYGTWSRDRELVMGNIRDSSFIEIWNSRTWNAFRLKHLREKEKPAVCQKCGLWIQNIYPEDVLDGDSERLIKLYEEYI